LQALGYRAVQTHKNGNNLRSYVFPARPFRAVRVENRTRHLALSRPISSRTRTIFNNVIALHSLEFDPVVYLSRVKGNISLYIKTRIADRNSAFRCKHQERIEDSFGKAEQEAFCSALELNERLPAAHGCALLTLSIQSNRANAVAAMLPRGNRFLQSFHLSFKSGESVGVDLEFRVLRFQRFDLLSQFLGGAHAQHTDCVVIDETDVIMLLSKDEDLRIDRCTCRDREAVPSSLCCGSESKCYYS
jgi:hypothetical protein